MSYLTGLITAQKDLMRNIPARVVAEYSKSDRFYGTVNGKLCFGYEECNQFEEAERTGAIALSRDHLSSFCSTGAQRAKIAEKVHKPPLEVNDINFKINGLNAFIWVPWSPSDPKKL